MISAGPRAAPATELPPVHSGRRDALTCTLWCNCRCLIRVRSRRAKRRAISSGHVLRILAARAKSARPAVRHRVKFATPEPHWKPADIAAGGRLARWRALGRARELASRRAGAMLVGAARRHAPAGGDVGCDGRCHGDAMHGSAGGTQRTACRIFASRSGSCAALGRIANAPRSNIAGRWRLLCGSMASAIGCTPSRCISRTAWRTSAMP